MNDDRELLKLAAKAAGVSLRWMKVKTFGGVIDVAEIDSYTGQEWNPLDDDGDALRLAVKLNVWPTRAETGLKSGVITVQAGAAYWEDLAQENVGDDPMAATRRAIVRAAAEIGNAMP